MVSTGGEEGTEAKILGRLPRRPPTGNREPRAASSVSAGLGRWGGGRAGSEARGWGVGNARPARWSALGARSWASSSWCHCRLSSAPHLSAVSSCFLRGALLTWASRATPARGGAGGRSCRRKLRSPASRAGVEGEGPAKRERRHRPSETPGSHGQTPLAPSPRARAVLHAAGRASVSGGAEPPGAWGCVRAGILPLFSIRDQCQAPRGPAGSCLWVVHFV